MKSTKLLSALLFFALLFTFSCQKDDIFSRNGLHQESTPETFPQYFGSEISRDFLGTVIDKNHNPIEGVTISIGHETALTDNNGVFIIRDATVNERFGYIKAEKAGYIHASRSVVPSDGTNKVKIMMLKETVTSTVSSGNPQTVTTDNGSSVSFDGNFIKEDGTAYSGSVDVIIHHLEPTHEDMALQMPGMLYAQNEYGAERMLQTFGMLAVELRGSGGEDLNLAEGSTAEIKIPVDASLMINAPATIPLWYFDETAGYWKEEGEATLQGNMYIGTVSHFSFWNCDLPAITVNLCVNVIDESGNELNNTQVAITSQTYGTTFGVTNESGQVCGFVPSNESLELNVFNHSICNSILHSENIGVYIVDSEITVIIPESPDAIQETVVGTLNTCDGNILTDGYVIIFNGGEAFYETTHIDGSFEVNLFRCPDENTFSFAGLDLNNQQTTDALFYTFNSPLTNIGNINPCNTYSEHITYTIDNETTVVVYPIHFAKFYPYTQSLRIGTTLPVNGSCFYLWGELYESNYLGTYDYYDFNQQGDTGISIIDLSPYGCPDVLNISSNNNNILYNVTTIGEVGEYIDIDFSGTYEDYEGNPHTINGVVHVIRDQE